jgi:hypothetical protein
MRTQQRAGGRLIISEVDVRWTIALALFCAACGNNDMSCPKTSSLGQTKDKVDILFMVDDSPSMTPKQTELQARFPELIKALDDMAAGGSPVDYHIGVVTSDLGAGPTPYGGCTPGGLGAKLQPIGRGHLANCQPPTGGLNFIDYNQITGTNNLPTGVDLASEFTCMASVGASGCGFEHQLEAAYKALHDCMPDASGAYPNCTIPENKGFLRPDSVLVVLLLTDEDDCSADPNTDLFDPNQTAYGADLSYRCTNYGIECTQGGSEQLMPYGDSGGALSSCQSAPNFNGAGPGKLYDLSRYLNFFTMPTSAGGVRDGAGNLVLAAIDAPSAPVQSIVANPMTFAPCAAGATIDGQKCAVLLQHSCNASSSFFGDPAVRINQLVNASAGSLVSSICDMDYTSAMSSVAQQIGMRVMGITPTAPTTGSSGATTGTSGATTGGGTTGGSTTGSCGSGGKVDNVAACQNFVKKVQCGSTDVSQYVDCSSYANVTCDISAYFTCIQPKFVCQNGMYDPTQLATLSDCASKATCP